MTTKKDIFLELGSRKEDLNPQQQAILKEIGTRPGFTGLINPKGAISTITGKPFPTIEEEFSSRKKLIKTAGPIAGDIALTMLAPELSLPGKVPGLLNLGKRLVTGGANLLGRAGASFAGSGAGEFAAQKITGEDTNLEKINLEGGIGAGTELAIGTLGGATKLASKVAKPALEIGAAFIPAAKRVGTRFREQLIRQQKGIIESATARSKRFVDEMGAKVSKEEAGLSVGNVFKLKQEESQNLYLVYNDAVNKVAKEGDGSVPIDSTNEFLSDILRDYKITNANNAGTKAELANSAKSARKDMLEDFGLKPTEFRGKVVLQMLEPGKTRPQDLKGLMARMWDDFKGLTSVEIENRELLKAALLDDLSVVKSSVTDQTAATIKQQADTIHGTFKTMMRESPTLSKFLAKSRGAPGLKFFEDLTVTPTGTERFVDALFKATPNELSKIRAEVGDEIFDGLRFNWIQDIFENSMTRTPSTGKTRVLPDALSENILKNKNRIIAIDKATGSDMWSKLEKEAEYYKSVAPKFETIDVDDSFAIDKVWDMVSEKTQKSLQRLAIELQASTKTATKIGIRQPFQDRKNRLGER